jgi:extracellular elastinolytic metalloproteinase
MSAPRWSGSRRRIAILAALGVGAASVLAGPLVSPARAIIDPVVERPASQGLGDVDARVGSLAPTAAQRSAVSGLGATARWNRFGTPQSLIKYGGYLGTGLSGDPAAAARAWLNRNRAIFKLSAAQVSALELVNVQRMAQSNGRAVLFRQKFGNLPAAVDGMVTVGVVSGKVAYASSSLAPTTATPQAASLTAVQAWLDAAQNVGRTVAASAVSGVRTDDVGWTIFRVAGFAQDQRARLRALPAPDGTVRAVFETNVVDVEGGAALAYTSFVDASTGDVLVRHGQVDHSTYSDGFQGEITATTCGPLHPFQVDGATKSVTAAASAAVVTNDIVLKIIANGTVVASSDTATSPEAATYSPSGGVPAGVYNVQVCPFADPTAPFVAPGTYAGTFTASEQQAQPVPYPPSWKYFLANPPLNFDPLVTSDNRKVGCWVNQVGGTPVPGCDDPPSPLINLAARGPWDYNFRTNTPTFTTEGNAASTAEAWSSPLTPGALGQRPLETDRAYIAPFQDRWNNSRCSPAELVPGGNDILASVTSLFSSHNRLHDWSYFLGFTELNYNLQDNNFGNRADGMLPTAGEGDPEVGNVQAGALTGGAPSYLGRDNANQITLQDGVPGITNQYLFQPIAGAFYAPCTDGDYDMSVIGHEYNHAISNRMVGGPDAGLTSYQGGSMGESWGDQVALEYMFEHGYSTGAGPAVEGPYVTGNAVTGIRNYALDRNPLQYGDLGYDVTGPEVHADGEPWSAVMWDVRQALISKYNGSFPVTNAALQRRCSQGDLSNTAPQPPLDASRCPGNRRWAQLLFDAYLLQPPGSTMLDARDAMLAADVMRFNGANQSVMWNAFAKRGFGQFADTATGEDDQPTPDYTSPAANEGTLRIAAQAFDKAGRPAVKGTLYLGQYEARVTPVADTDTATPLGRQVRLVPGTYTFVFQAEGYGLLRFSQTVGAGQTVDRVLHLATNLASSSSGATVAASSAGSLNTTRLIDDTEATNWAGINPGGTSVDAVSPYVAVDLAGGQSVVRSVRVSAMLRPPNPDADDDPNQPDEESGSRFTALRKFAIETCVQTATANCASPLPAGAPGSPYQRIYTSADNAFPATRPRPLAPNLLFQTFDVPDTPATHVRLVALENQCSGTPEYAGEQDNDPLNATDCKAASDRDESVRAAELEVFGFDSTTRPPGDPVVVTTMTGPATARPGGTVTYVISYTNLGPQPSANAMVTDVLPAQLSFVSATRGGTYTAATRTVRWGLGTVAVNGAGSLSLTARIGPTVPLGTTILNQAQFSGALTFSPPAAAVTTVSP